MATRSRELLSLGVVAKTKTLGEALWDRREKLGLTQEVVAQRLGITQGNYSRWERDLAEPRDAENFVSISEFLKTPMKGVAALVAETVLQRVLTELDQVQNR